MVKRMMLVVIVLLMAAGCADRDITASIMTGQRTDMKVLAGTEVAGIGVGAVVAYDTSSAIAWGPEGSRLGFYIQGDPSWLLTAVDTEEAAPAGLSILDGLQVEPYGRIEWLDGSDDDNFDVRPQWIVGTRWLLSEDGEIAIVTEYSTGDAEPSDGYIGVAIRF